MIFCSEQGVRGVSAFAQPQEPALAQEQATRSLRPPVTPLGVIGSPRHGGTSLSPAPSLLPPSAPGGTAFQKMEPRENRAGHNLRQDGENLEKKQVGSTCRQIWGGDDSSEEGLGCHLLERGGKVGRGERNGETFAGQDPVSKQHQQQQTTAGGMQTLSCHGNRTRQLIQTEANRKEIKPN